MIEFSRLLRLDEYVFLSGGFNYKSYLIHKGMDGSEEGAIKLFMQLRDKMMQIMTSLTFRLVEGVIEIIHNAGGKSSLPGNSCAIGNLQGGCGQTCSIGCRWL